MPRNARDSELFIGLITTVGTETDGVIQNLKDQLTKFHYDVEVIIVSKEIISQFEEEGSPELKSEFDRVNYYMDLGNLIRQNTKSNSILMKGVARNIYLKRKKDEKGSPQIRRRTAYIIKSLKHPEEVDFMRDSYGDGFHLIGVTSSKKRRLSYLTQHKGLTEEQAIDLLKRDENEDLKQGQHTRDAFQHADYFVTVTGDTDHAYNSISRLIDLIFGDPFISPSFDEYAMFMAYASSLRSADLSRQVGAVVTKNNEILSTGANDCPKFGGGLYWPALNKNGKYEDVPSGRDYTLNYDPNKLEQQNLIESLFSKFDIENTEENREKARKSGIGDLTEYGRAVHGEMEALLSCARNNISCRGATLYATTFPCHNCAKHIIAAGIERVVYIEPYPKSKAFDFYPVEITDESDNSNAVVANESEGGNKVLFEPFIGVGPQRFIDLFSLKSTRWYDRKRKDRHGIKLEWKREEAELRNPISLLNYLNSEELALMAFENETTE